MKCTRGLSLLFGPESCKNHSAKPISAVPAPGWVMVRTKLSCTSTVFETRGATLSCLSWLGRADSSYCGQFATDSKRLVTTSERTAGRVNRMLSEEPVWQDSLTPLKCRECSRYLASGVRFAEERVSHLQSGQGEAKTVIGQTSQKKGIEPEKDLP